MGDSPQRGPPDAWVTVVEFSDFECPFCRREQPILTDIEALYGADLRVVFKHFPLPSIHPHAQAAAIASECASPAGSRGPITTTRRCSAFECPQALARSAR